MFFSGAAGAPAEVVHYQKCKMVVGPLDCEVVVEIGAACMGRDFEVVFASFSVFEIAG